MQGLDVAPTVAMTLREFGEKLYEYVALPIAIIFVMFAVLLGVSKVWDPKWNMGIKTTMVIVVFIVELACVFVLPFGIGAEARNLFGKIF